MSKRTREFGFPNNGHSIRKLVNELKELGDVMVTLEYTPCQYDTEDFDVFFEVTEKREDTHCYNALLLADKLQSMGTRFTAEIKYKKVELSFHTKWSDIAHNTDEYGVI